MQYPSVPEAAYHYVQPIEMTLFACFQFALIPHRDPQNLMVQNRRRLWQKTSPIP